MGQRERPSREELKVTFEAVAGRQGGGIFAIEDAAEEMARRTKLAHIAEQIARYDRGYAGNRRRCPQCGQWQQYKGERAREVVFDCGTVTVERAYYVCPGCGRTSCPLDEQLGLVEGKEQGRLREKLALLAVVVPYHQAPQVCQTLLGSECHAMTLRRVALREAARLTASGHHQTLPTRGGGSALSGSRWASVSDPRAQRRARRSRVSGSQSGAGVLRPRCGGGE